MDNEKAIACLSAEWFRQKAQEPEYAAFDVQIRAQLAWFEREYGIETLKALSGKNLLNKMFYNDTAEKENLCYTLEMNPDIRANFGSISGGSAFKFALFFHSQKQKWVTGSSTKPIELSEEEAIRRGTEIRDNLIAGAEEIAAFHELRSEADYDELKKRIEKHIRIDSLWILKYYEMIYPTYFATAYNENHQRHMLYALQIQPADNQLVRMGQLALFSKKCGIWPAIMGRIFSDRVGWYKPFYRIGTGQDGECFPDWHAKNYCALGFNKIGKFTDYLNEKGKADKDKIISALLERYDSYNKSTASRKANEIVSFIDTPADETMIVAMNGQKMLGIGLLTGELYSENNADDYLNRRKVKWLYVPAQPVMMPLFEGRQTSFVSMSDDKNMMLVYRLLYHEDEVPGDLWWPEACDYDPGISKERWIELLRREDVLGPVWGGLLAAFYIYGPATCSEIGNIYHKKPYSISGNATQLAKKIQTITQCSTYLRESGENRYWPILFQGKSADKTQQGSFIWKLRAELYDALTEIGIENYDWDNNSDPQKTAWLLMWNPNSWKWDNYHQRIDSINSGNKETDTWSCANKQAKVGDRFYLAVCGRDVKSGIVGSGIIVNPTQMRPHWDEQKKKEGKQYRSVGVEFDKLVDYEKNGILPIETLQSKFPNQVWSSQTSGIRISAEYVDELSALWYGSGINAIRYSTGYTGAFSRNRIVFGAPGTGKSFRLNLEKDILLAKGGGFERVTFHPDYTYAHFVGTYKPVPCMDENGNHAITYKYVPGPFMRTYVKALRNSREETPLPFLMIIEEINRANVAAVFGDIFQLLDRDDDGTSMYPIQASEDMKQYLSEELCGKASDFEEIKLPDNMFLWATMNSADQGVFPMDTAFKRRWDFSYLNINSGEDEIKGKKVVLGMGQYQHAVEWNRLRRAINDKLSSLRINEDKLLGPFFLKVSSEDQEIDSKAFSDAFKNKVLMYLYEDAAKQKRASLFAESVDSTKFSSVCEAFDERGVEVFCSDISNRFRVAEMLSGDGV